MAGTVRGVAALQEELAKAKESLKDVDENIKKLTGRDPGDNRPPQRRVSIGSSPAGPGTREQRLFAVARRTVLDEGMTPSPKRRAVGGAFSRLGPRVGAPHPRLGRRDSGDEEDASNKPTIQSSVVASPAENRRREDLVREQNKDVKGRARNRRMFGLLLGTLQKFQTEAKDETEKERQRKAIEQKLEEKAKQEKDDLRKERQTLFSDRRQKQDKLKRLEQKMELVQIHEDWEKETKRLMNFIRTKAKPHIYYLPKSQTSTSEKKMRDTKKVLEGIIKDRRKHLEEEIEELTGGDQDEEPKPVSRKRKDDVHDIDDKEDVMDVQQPQVEVMAHEEDDMEEMMSVQKSTEQKDQPSPGKSPDKPVPHSPPDSPPHISPSHAVQETQASEDKENKEHHKGTSDSRRNREHEKEEKNDDKKDHNESDSDHDISRKKSHSNSREKGKRRHKSSDRSHSEKSGDKKNGHSKSKKSRKSEDKKGSESSSSSSSGSSSEDSSSASSSSSSEDEGNVREDITLSHKPEDIPFPDMPPVLLEDVPMPDEPDNRRVVHEKMDI